MSDAVPTPEERGCTNIFTWRGLMSDMDKRTRVAAYTILAVAVVSLIMTQLGFVEVFGVHLMLVLIPIALGAEMYGPRSGAALGLIAGVATMLHAMLLPFDYYEKFFAAPINSIFLFGITGFATGVLFALAYNVAQNDSKKALILTIVACFLSSWFCSTFFHVNSYLITKGVAGDAGTAFLREVFDFRTSMIQLVVDGILMTLAVIGAGIGNIKRREYISQERSLRETFMGWLLAVVAVTFMLANAIGYATVTVALIRRANTTLEGHLDYLSTQLQERDGWISHITDVGHMSSGDYDSIMSESIEGLATGLKLGENGVTIIAEDGKILSSNDTRYVGRSFEEAIGEGLENGFSPSIYTETSPLQFYLGNGAELSYMRAAEISYIRVEKAGNYQLAAILPASEVFFYRTVAIGIIGAIFLTLFVLVSWLAMRLLDVVVVRGIDETNQTLDRITHGDLDQTVNVRDSREFSSLSTGINSTVGALKDSIAEASGRLDRELATAKAIQANALPSTFPPFPQVDKFDIYASMEPAKEVGGDFYDFFLLEDGVRLGIVMADVSGKGIPASLFMMSAKTEIENYMLTGMPLAEAIQTANYRLCQGNDADMFVTVFAAILDYSTGMLEYVNAGHNPPLLRHNGEWAWLREKSGLFLGTFDTATYRPYKIQLSPKDSLFLYTDGVTEAVDDTLALYGDKRLMSFLVDHADLGPRRLVESVRRDLKVFANGADQADDITMLCIEYGVPPRVTSSKVFPAQIDQLGPAQEFIHTELARRACPISIQNKIDICFEELFVNIAHYAYPEATEDDPGKVRVAFTYNTNPQGMTIQLIDEGKPFNPLANADPTVPESAEEAAIGGLGIFMAKKLSDDIHYTFRDDCNITSFTKNW